MARTSSIKTKSKGKKPPVIKDIPKTSTLTLRLDPAETKELGEVAKLLHVGSGAGAVSRLIMGYSSMRDQLQEAKTFGDSMTRKYWDLKRLLDEKMSIDNRITKLLSDTRKEAPSKLSDPDFDEDEDEDDNY